MITALEGYPFDQMTERFLYRAEVGGELEALHGRLPGVLPRTGFAREAVAGRSRRPEVQAAGFEALHYEIDGPHRMVTHRRQPGWRMPTGHAEADGDRDAQRPVRAVGRARPRRRARRPA